MPRKAGESDSAKCGEEVFVLLVAPFEVRRGVALQTVPKKAQGLVAYLASQLGRPVSREHLATLLWGNSGTEQARQSLRQALVALRNALGPKSNDLLATDTASVLLQSRDALQIDIVQYEAACRSSARQDLERAASLYRGEFLADLHIPVEPFSEWVSLERQRIATLQSDLLLRLAEARASAADGNGAIASARNLTTHDPLREEGHRLLMRLLVAVGQRTAALQQYDKLTKLLQDQLGIPPDRDSVALAAQIRAGRIAIEQERQPVTSSPVPPRQDLIAVEARPMVASGPSLPDKPSIVVLPFTNLSGDAGQDYFVDGLVEDITIALGRERWLFVISSPSAFAFRDRNVDLREIATRLGVRYVLRGSVRRSGERLRVVVLLTDAASGEFVWSNRFEDVIDNVFDLNDRLMTHVAAMIGPALRSVEIERAQRKAPASLSAFDLYLQATPRVRSDLTENRRALQLLEQAIALDPSYSAAYALAARCYQFQRLMGWVPLADPGLERGAGFARLAVELGKDDSEALWMASHAIPHLTGEIDHAAVLIDRSLNLNPNSANAWSSSCFVYSLLGQFAKAIDHFYCSQRLNPLDQLHHVHWNIAGMAYFGLEQFEEANAAADKALSVRPAYPQALRLKIASLGAFGHRSEARAFVQRLLAVHPECNMKWLEEFNGRMMVRAPKFLDTFLACARRGGMPEAPPARGGRTHSTLQ